MLTSIRVQCRWHTSRAMRKILRLISLILIEVSCFSCGWSYLLYMKVISTGLNSRMYSYWSITEPVQSVRPSEWIASGTMKATNCKQRIKHLKTTFLAACKFIFESRFISKQAPCLYLRTSQCHEMVRLYLTISIQKLAIRRKLSLSATHWNMHSLKFKTFFANSVVKFLTQVY